jgi:hypothetical protein
LVWQVPRGGEDAPDLGAVGKPPGGEQAWLPGVVAAGVAAGGNGVVARAEDPDASSLIAR